MIGVLRNMGRTRACLAALLIVVCATPAAVSAEAIRFTNATTGAVTVQVSYIVQGRVILTPRVPLGPGDMTPAIVVPGNKIVYIYDDPRKNPNRLLHQATFPAGLGDLHFGIVADVPVPRVKLVEIKPAPPAHP
jgi:hypothetical protein